MNLIRFEPPAKELPKRRSAAHGGLEPPRSRRLCEDVLSISVAMSGRRRRLLRAGYSPIYPKTEAAAELRAEGNRESGCRKGGQKNCDRPLPKKYSAASVSSTLIGRWSSTSQLLERRLRWPQASEARPLPKRDPSPLRAIRGLAFGPPTRAVGAAPGRSSTRRGGVRRRGGARR
jgi:hypothetical protein